MRRPSQSLIIAALSVSCALVPLVQAEAQIALDRTELVLRPDSVTRRSGVVMVRNTGRSRSAAVIRIEDWDRSADGAHRFYEAGTQPGSCATVLAVSPLEFTLAPGESQALHVGVDGEVNSACWSLVLVESEERVPDESGKLVPSLVRTGLKVYAEPTGLRTSAEVSDVEVETSEAAHNASRLATITFRNTGERHLKGEGRIEILGPDARVLTTLPLPVLQTLPGASMTARVSLPEVVKGSVTLRAVVNYGGDSVAASERQTVVK